VGGGSITFMKIRYASLVAWALAVSWVVVRGALKALVVRVGLTRYQQEDYRTNLHFST